MKTGLIEKINILMQKPKIYTPGSAFMWNDDYLSKQLLRVHLNENIDLASRKGETIDKTLEWILAQTKTNSKMQILDLGCGPGLYCKRLADKGHTVTGMDISDNSIDYAKQEAQRNDLEIEFILANYLKADLGENKYDLITLIYCDFGVLNPSEQNILLEKINRALKPEGIFVFDVLNDINFQARKKENSWACAKKGFWKNNPYLALSNSFFYKEEKVILNQHLIISQDNDYEIYRFWNHFFSDEKLEKLLKFNNLKLIKTYNNLLPQTSQWDGENVTFCVVGKQ